MFYNSLILILFFPLKRALSYAYSNFTAIFNSFLLAVYVILAETFDLLYNNAKLIAQFLPRLGEASYLCCLSLDQFLTTKGNSSEV